MNQKIIHEIKLEIGKKKRLWNVSLKNCFRRYRQVDDGQLVQI